MSDRYGQPPPWGQLPPPPTKKQSPFIWIGVEVVIVVVVLVTRSGSVDDVNCSESCR